MTSKTNNEEYHCDREEPLDREEPSAEPINLHNEEPEDLDCPNCCEPCSDSSPATPACPNPACPHNICQPCLDKWKSSSDLCMYCRQINISPLRQFDVSVYKFDEHVSAYNPIYLFYEHVMAQQYFDHEMLRGEMGCVPDYLNGPDPDDVDTVTVTSEEADGLIEIFDRIVQGGRHESAEAFARANRPFVRETFPDATPRAVSDALVFAYTTMPEETREEKARRLIDEAGAAAFSTDLPDADTLPRPLRCTSLYNDEEEHKTDNIAEAIETCHRIAIGKNWTNDIKKAAWRRLTKDSPEDIWAEVFEICERLITDDVADLVGAYNVAKYIAEYRVNNRVNRQEALGQLDLSWLRTSPRCSNIIAAQYEAFAKIIDRHGAHKFLYTCSVPWREVRELLPRMVLAKAFAETDPGVWSRPIVR
jgi:hypothetical protein